MKFCYGFWTIGSQTRTSCISWKKLSGVFLRKDQISSKKEVCRSEISPPSFSQTCIWTNSTNARYTDDFVIVSNDREFLSNILDPINRFLRENLALELHPKKVAIRKCRQGVDFLGYVVMPHCLLLRTKTKRRIFKKLKERIREYESGERSEESLNQCLQSYLGVLSHANAYELTQDILNRFWFWLNDWLGNIKNGHFNRTTEPFGTARWLFQAIDLNK